MSPKSRVPGASLFIGGLEVQLAPKEEGPFARQFKMRCERIEAIILAGEVEQAETYFAPVAMEAVAGQQIELPDQRWRTEP